MNAEKAVKRLPRTLKTGVIETTGWASKPVLARGKGAGAALASGGALGYLPRFRAMAGAADPVFHKSGPVCGMVLRGFGPKAAKRIQLRERSVSIAKVELA